MIMAVYYVLENITGHRRFLSGQTIRRFACVWWICPGDVEIAGDPDVFRLADECFSLSSTLLCLRLYSGVCLVRFSVSTWFRAGGEEIAGESDVF